MKTTHKIGVARMIYHAVHAGRTLLGQTDRVTVVRDDVTYDLDLSQGIDFAIYLGNIYERQTRAALRKLVSGTNIFILSDEVYEHIIFDNASHLSMLRFPDLWESRRP